MKSKITVIKKNHCNHSKKGQGILDYVFLLTIVIVVLLIMGYYVRNSLSGKIRETSDSFGRGEVYMPGLSTVTH